MEFQLPVALNKDGILATLTVHFGLQWIWLKIEILNHQASYIIVVQLVSLDPIRSDPKIARTIENCQFKRPVSVTKYFYYIKY